MVYFLIVAEAALSFAQHKRYTVIMTILFCKMILYSKILKNALKRITCQNHKGLVRDENLA